MNVRLKLKRNEQQCSLDKGGVLQADIEAVIQHFACLLGKMKRSQLSRPTRAVAQERGVG